MIELLLALILAHIIADFVLQPNAWIDCRHHQHWRSPALYKHMAIHGAIYLILLPMFIPWPWALVASTLLMLIHGVIDAVKSYYQHSLKSFLLDQAAHLLTIALAWLWLTEWPIEQLHLWWSRYADQFLLLLLAYTLCTKPASVLISTLLQRWRLADSHQSQTSLMAAGETIGYLERGLIVTFVLLGQYGGIGFLLAAKSVFRFGDLSKGNDRTLTEYVLLGSLTSVAVAMATGIMASQLLSRY